MEAAEDASFLSAMRRANIKGALVGVEAVTRARTQALWDRFYSLRQIWARSRCTPNFRARLAFVLISKLYR